MGAQHKHLYSQQLKEKTLPWAQIRSSDGDDSCPKA